MTAVIDGITIKEAAASSDDGNLYIQAPYLFRGTHKLKLTSDLFKDIERDFDVDENGDYSDAVVDYIQISDLELKNTDELQNIASDFLKKIYAGALEKKAFSEVVSDLPLTEETNETLKESYDSYVTNNIKSKTHLSGVTFDNIDLSVISFTEDEEGFAIRTKLDYTYQASSVIYSFWSEKKSKGSYSGERTDYIDFLYKGGKWYISNTYILNPGVYYKSY